MMAIPVQTSTVGIVFYWVAYLFNGQKFNNEQDWYKIKPVNTPE